MLPLKNYMKFFLGFLPTQEHVRSE